MRNTILFIVVLPTVSKEFVGLVKTLSFFQRSSLAATRVSSAF
jgi:hypothetical protein